AILERPSRFDRKYHFDLPGPDERSAYLTLWNDAQEAELRLSEAGIAHVVGLTEEFSFAYLKELFLSSMMRWIAESEEGQMESLMAAQVTALREQMSSAAEEFGEALPNDDPSAVAQRGMQAMMAMMRRR